MKLNSVTEVSVFNISTSSLFPSCQQTNLERQIITEGYVWNITGRQLNCLLNNNRTEHLIHACGTGVLWIPLIEILLSVSSLWNVLLMGPRELCFMYKDGYCQFNLCNSFLCKWLSLHLFLGHVYAFIQTRVVACWPRNHLVSLK
jgi:hypothetical protein